MTLEDFMVQTVAIAFTAILFSRLVNGPQKDFARVSSLSIVAGLFFMKCTVEQGDDLYLMGVLFTLFGWIVGIFMLYVELHWRVSRELFFKKKTNRWK